MLIYPERYILYRQIEVSRSETVKTRFCGPYFGCRQGKYVELHTIFKIGCRNRVSLFIYHADEILHHNVHLTVNIGYDVFILEANPVFVTGILVLPLKVYLPYVKSASLNPWGPC